MDLVYAMPTESYASPPMRWDPAWVADVSPVGAQARGILLRGRLDQSHTIRFVLPVWLERDESGHYLVSDDVFLQWGEGLTIEEAIADYRATMAEYYDLVADGAADSVSDQSELSVLRRYIRA